MKITPEILSIPPYVSTKWTSIASIRLKNPGSHSVLIISLNEGSQVEIPNLSQTQIDEIFQAHAHFSTTNPSPLGKGLFDTPFSFSLPMKLDGGLTDPLASGLQHNPEQSELPALPGNILEKIRGIIRSFGIENSSILGPPEQNCNCIYCQLARSFQEEEEVVTDSDLHFRDWEVSEVSDKLYRVVNPIDSNEHYDVYLGDPLGCTCGKRNCEHIRAALNT